MTADTADLTCGNVFPAFVSMDALSGSAAVPNASTTGSYPDQMAQIDEQMIVEAKSLKFNSANGTLEASWTLDPYLLF